MEHTKLTPKFGAELAPATQLVDFTDDDVAALKQWPQSAA